MVQPDRTLTALPRPHRQPTASGGLTDAGPELFRRAIEGNQRLFLLRAARYSGGLPRRDGGVHWLEYSEPAASEIHIPFPRFNPGQAGRQLNDLLSQMAVRRIPARVRLWAPEPARPPDLAGLLMARGFRPGFRPHWMRLDLWRLRDVRWGPHGLRIETARDPTIWDRFVHPDHGDSPGGRAEVRAESAMARALPDHLVRIVAWLAGTPVGTATLHLTGGALGIAGIYGVAVLPDCRNRGIGKALTSTACRVAWERGYAVAGLNATPSGEPVYRRLGFESGGEGQTWELPIESLTGRRPSALDIRFAEAIAAGDLATLDQVDQNLSSDALDVTLACGLTPIQLAARFQRRDVANWLRGRGATLDVRSAWELGWRQRAIRALAERPELANERTGPCWATPLHDAVERGDADFARLLLAAGANPALRDGTYDATPLEWARHLGQTELVTLLHDAGYRR